MLNTLSPEKYEWIYYILFIMGGILVISYMHFGWYVASLFFLIPSLMGIGIYFIIKDETKF